MADKVRILAVDDSSISLAAIERELGNREYEVIPVNSGLRALQYLKRKKADLIILDIQMAVKDGIETLKEIRSMENCRHIPVIMLTSKGDRKTIMESSKLGIYDYVLKPFSKQDLQQRVERVLKKVQGNKAFIEQLKQGSLSLESMESLGSLESLEKMGSMESWENVGSLESLENVGSMESWENVGSLESMESWENVGSLESLEKKKGF